VDTSNSSASKTFSYASLANQIAIWGSVCPSNACSYIAITGEMSTPSVDSYSTVLKMDERFDTLWKITVLGTIHQNGIEMDNNASIFFTPFLDSS
jgi:hypothetical protein